MATPTESGDSSKEGPQPQVSDNKAETTESSSGAVQKDSLVPEDNTNNEHVSTGESAGGLHQNAKAYHVYKEDELPPRGSKVEWVKLADGIWEKRVTPPKSVFAKALPAEPIVTPRDAVADWILSSDHETVADWFKTTSTENDSK